MAQVTSSPNRECASECLCQSSKREAQNLTERTPCQHGHARTLGARPCREQGSGVAMRSPWGLGWPRHCAYQTVPSMKDGCQRFQEGTTLARAPQRRCPSLFVRRHAGCMTMRRVSGVFASRFASTCAPVVRVHGEPRPIKGELGWTHSRVFCPRCVCASNERLKFICDDLVRSQNFGPVGLYFRIPTVFSHGLSTCQQQNQRNVDEFFFFCLQDANCIVGTSTSA
jgi:hypothetical protein